MKNLTNFLLLIAVLSTLGAMAAYAKSSPLKDLGTAEFLIPIEITGLKGNVVSFNIPENAREYDRKGNEVQLSGLYDVAQGKDVNCPYMLSTDIHKKVKNYSPFNGRAVVDAHFANEQLAQAAFKNKCILIENVE